MSYSSAPQDLSRFLAAQEDDYDIALQEIRQGRKRSHWMWYIFPQFDGLAFSEKSQYYAIKSVDEAKAYLAHPVLGPRLKDCAMAAQSVEGRTAEGIFGSPDDMKFKSSLTLFAAVSPTESIFERLLEKYFQGEIDERTMELLGTESDG